MKIAFVSNFYNHHQSSFSCCMDELTDHNYSFIATEPMDEERKAMGWDGICLPNFVIDYNENPTQCAKVIGEADVVIFVNHTYKNEPQTDRKRAILYTALTRARFFLYCLDYEENIELRVE